MILPAYDEQRYTCKADGKQEGLMQEHATLDHVMGAMQQDVAYIAKVNGAVIRPHLRQVCQKMHQPIPMH